MFENKNIHPRIERISYLMTQKSPFFSEFLLRYSYYKTDSISTFATGIKDGRIFLLWNEEFLNSLTDEELEGILIHEIYHIITLSQRRGKSKDHKLWNYATDAVNNNNIVNSSLNGNPIKLPKDGVYMEKFYEMGYNDEIVAEKVYNFLYEKADKISFVLPQSSGGSGEDSQSESNDGNSESEDKGDENQQGGSSGESKDGKEEDSSGGSGDSGEKKEITVFDEHGSLNEDEVSEVEKEIIENIVKDSQAKGWGNFSGNLKRDVEELIKPKRVHISQKLRSKLSEHLSSSGKQRFTWKRRNRRGLPLQGKVRTKTKINIFIDNSGSCWNPKIASLFFGQLEDFTRMGFDTSVYCFDTKVYTVKENYKTGDYKNIQLPGGGGTAVQPIFNFLKNNNKEKESCIILTDGYFNWDFDDYKIDPLWMITEEYGLDHAPKDKRFLLRDRN